MLPITKKPTGCGRDIKPPVVPYVLGEKGYYYGGRRIVGRSGSWIVVRCSPDHKWSYCGEDKSLRSDWTPYCVDCAIRFGWEW